MQTAPAPQVLPAQQGCPGAPQVCTQLPFSQVFPALQVLFGGQQTWPACPQATQVAVSRLQKADPLHPGLSESRGTQHCCPGAPHASQTMGAASMLQVAPDPQKLKTSPWQHGCPACPQS
jgi:hypothetical protein